MKRFCVAMLILGMVVSTIAFAASTDNHTVTVTVPTVNELAITGGNLTLTFAAPTGGGDFANVTDNATCDLEWSTNTASQKITVASNIAAPEAALYVTSGSVTGGTSAGEVTLGTTAADFVTGVSVGSGSCDLQYRAAATLAGSATGSEVHTVTYTITSS